MVTIDYQALIAARRTLAEAAEALDEAAYDHEASKDAWHNLTRVAGLCETAEEAIVDALSAAYHCLGDLDADAAIHLMLTARAGSV